MEVKPVLARALRRGDAIGFVAPSGKLKTEHRELLLNVEKHLEQFGIQSVEGRNIWRIDRFGESAGSPAERAADFNEMFCRPEVRAIWGISGGDTANEILDLLDFENIRRNPKIVVGLSDNSLLLNALTARTGLVTFHGPDPKEGKPGEHFSEPYTWTEFERRLLRGEPGDVPPVKPRKTIRGGKARGRLVGGNLSCLLKLAGTKYWPRFDDGILVLEGLRTTVGAALHRVTQLRQLGVFDQVRGVLLGDFYSFDRREIFGPSGKRILLEDILEAALPERVLPVLKCYDFGHYCANTFLPLGAEAEIDADAQTISLTQPFVARE